MERAGEVRVCRAQSVRLRGVVLSPHARLRAALRLRYGDWETFFDCFLRGEVDFGDYFDHLVSWWPHRAAANVLFLTYEHMLAAPVAAVGSIARFLGGRAGELARDPRRLEGVVASQRFQAHAERPRSLVERRPAGMPAFVRKGVVGDWRSHFTADQTRRLAAKFRARTAGTTYRRPMARSRGRLARVSVYGESHDGTS